MVKVRVKVIVNGRFLGIVMIMIVMIMMKILINCWFFCVGVSGVNWWGSLIRKMMNRIRKRRRVMVLLSLVMDLVMILSFDCKGVILGFLLSDMSVLL